MKYVDLFAGCGGLSLGFERAGFELVLAVEKSEMAAHTFYHNFIKEITDEADWKKYNSLSIDDQFKQRVLPRELGELLASKQLMKKLKGENIDIVVGGPPCQGFSLAGKRNPEDERNKLPWQFLEFVEQTNPKAVVIENVVGISRGFKKGGREAPFDQLQEALRKIGKGYVVQPVHVNAMHFGVPEHRPRLMILGLRKDVAVKKNIKSTDKIWYSNFLDSLSDIPTLAPKPTLYKNEALDLCSAIGDFSKPPIEVTNKSSKKFRKEMRDNKLWKLRKAHSVQKHENHNSIHHLEKTVSRFRLYQYLNSQKLASNTLNIPAKNEDIVAKKQLEEILDKCTIPAYAPDGTIIAKTKKDLINLIFDLKTKKHSQRSLSWDKPSPTVVTLPDDYIHPSEPRIFSVRELARMQSFPDAFVFKSKETTGSNRRKFEVPQYSQVGNAVAPLVAYSVAKKFYEILEGNEKINGK